MKALLLALNSKYIHTNLAVRYLKEYALEHGISDVDFVEYTINHHLPFVIDQMYRLRPQVLVLSCYIWNVEMILDFAAEYKLIAPETLIVAGGPEVSYNCREVLEQNPAIDMVLSGEGEKPFTRLMEHLNGLRPIEQVRSLFYRQEGQILSTPMEEEIRLQEPALRLRGHRQAGSQDLLLRDHSRLSVPVQLLPVLHHQKRAVYATGAGLPLLAALPGSQGPAGQVCGPHL